MIRRTFALGATILTVALLAAGTPALGVAGSGNRHEDPVAADTTTPIKHFLFLMQENHTFDNYFGTRPGVDGIPTGTCMPRNLDDQSAGCVKPFHIGTQAIMDLDHTAEAFAGQYNNGRMNGFVNYFTQLGRDPRQAELTMGYYDQRDLPFYWNVADSYVLFDRFFSSAHGGSVRNHMFRVTGGPGSPDSESIPIGGWGDIPTIFDRLEEKGISWKFYVQNYDPTITFRQVQRGQVEEADRAAQVVWVPLLSFARFVDDPELNSHIVDLREYYSDLQAGTLPSVAFIAPSGNSEHPPGSIQAGERFVRSLINELMKSSAWDSSAFLWSYDDWGGWFDHVRPPQVDAYGYGFRVPALLVSSYAKQGYVDSTTLDFTSALAFIEHNWKVAPLASRDRHANTFLDAFDFTSPPREPLIIDDTVPANPSARPTVGFVYAGYTLVALLVALAVWRVIAARRRTRLDDAAADGERT